ncbi:MAG: glucose-1-phosphate adenylyltransferase [Verrucomicrobiota bacterium]|jgi:glucose-1-phosphate adenylyltransferase|nr:glucose-1-phosphate adenylyltransferase [Verrucomicrobiota bacterium]|tara:strand:- start:3285 stop:4589 length:1305 start_codon:yes stop_codon:yes gene_type:complete
MSQVVTRAGKARVLSVVMGGGQGSRLFPLTRDRSKPAVPLAGKYRLVDIPISNCINSRLNQIYLLTQFNSASLHRHITHTYKFDRFSGGFVDILAAEQTPTSDSWYEGTADAVRKNLSHLLNNDFEYIMILSGDQLYRIDFREIIAVHIEREAELTVATIPVGRDLAPSFGIMHNDDRGRISRFVEKPNKPELLDSLKLSPDQAAEQELESGGDHYLASMGIYLFNRKSLIELLDNDMTDFGKHIIPRSIETHRVYSFVYRGYWEDIGTIRAFFEANLDMTSMLPQFDFFQMETPVYTRARFLPASKINGAAIEQAIISDGCIIDRSRISHSLIGVRSFIASGCRLHRSILLGSNKYETEASKAESDRDGIPRVGVGENTRIENTIIDKDARIGANCVITPDGKPMHFDDENYFIRDGIVIIPRNAVIPNGTLI